MSLETLLEPIFTDKLLFYFLLGTWSISMQGTKNSECSTIDLDEAREQFHFLKASIPLSIRSLVHLLQDRTGLDKAIVNRPL